MGNSKLADARMVPVAPLDERTLKYRGQRYRFTKVRQLGPASYAISAALTYPDDECQQMEQSA